MSILFPLMSLFIFSMVAFVIVKNILTWNKNNHAPRLTVSAVIVAKRTITHHHHHNGHHHHSHTYHVTFEVQSGDRMEFKVSREEYGLLAEGDTGMLFFQGTRYLSFERTYGQPGNSAF